MERFTTIEQILSHHFSDKNEIQKGSRVLKSTRIEQAIYEDLHNASEELSEYEMTGKSKLKTFDSLVNDVFQSVYGLKPKFVEDKQMSALAGKFNKNILNKLMEDENYSAVKSVCEGKELPAIGATEEFAQDLLEKLDALMEQTTGGNGKVDALEKMEQDRQDMIQSLSELMEKRENTNDQQREKTEKKIIQTANRILSKEEQTAMYEALIENASKQNTEKIKAAVASAVNRAKQKADDVTSSILSWGDGSADMQKNPVNIEVLKRVGRSEKLRYIARFLGRYKQMLNSKRLAGYTYGRGEKYDIEYGNNISRALTSELSMLAMPEMIPLFMRKYQNRAIKQYRRREPEYKGKGDIIVCLDESGSTFGEMSAYGMAVAMVLCEICKVNNTSFALVHFSTECKTDIFQKDAKINSEKMLATAETFLGGGTDFNKPLVEVITLMQDNQFQKPDIVFITDGISDVSDEILKEFKRLKEATGAKLAGILLDRGQCFEFTLEKFADNIYRTSDLENEKIVERLIDERI